MKKTLHIDEKLLAEAKKAANAKTDTEAVKLALEALVRHAAYQRAALLGGTQPGAKDVYRRRYRCAVGNRKSPTKKLLNSSNL